MMQSVEARLRRIEATIPGPKASPADPFAGRDPVVRALLSRALLAGVEADPDPDPDPILPDRAGAAAYNALLARLDAEGLGWGHLDDRRRDRAREIADGLIK